MALELNAECSICGKKYHICRTCEETVAFKPWRAIVDSIEHYKVYLIIWSYNHKEITKEEAKEQLKECKIDDYKSFLPEIIAVIDEIYDEVKDEVSTQDSETVTETAESTDEETEEIGTETAEKQASENVYSKENKSYKKNNNYYKNNKKRGNLS